MKKKSLTLMEHKALAEKLHAMRNKLVHLAVMTGNSKNNGPSFKRLRRAYQAIDEARNSLENNLFQTWPDEAKTTTYYPDKAQPLCTPLSEIKADHNEAEYRRGYCDGWILAVESMRPGKLYNQLFNFWESELKNWRHEEPDKMIEPPLPGKSK